MFLGCYHGRNCIGLFSMGAPKQKWTPEEEEALKAGVIKHGQGRWCTILKDPEFSSVLYLRSNVDLKDKWRNMCVMPHGYNSRDKSKLAPRRAHQVTRQGESSLAHASIVHSDEELVDTMPLQVSYDTVAVSGPKRSFVRLDNLIVEAIISLNEVSGSNKTAIATYIEEQYWAPSDFKRLLSAKLKYMTLVGKLIKVKRRYMVPSLPTASSRRRNSLMFYSDGRKRDSSIVEKDDIKMLTMSEVDLELAKMRTMTAEEAALVAARAVAEAEAAITRAEEAERDAAAAEADAEAAQAFADATMKNLKGKNSPKMMIRA